jgi:hypothetical protein
MWQQYQWHRCTTNVFSNIFAYNPTHCFYKEIWLTCTCHSGVIDTAVTSTSVSWTRLWHAQRYQWHRCDMHSGVNDTAVTCTAVAMTPLWHVQRWQWQRCSNMTPLWLWTSGSGCLGNIYLISEIIFLSDNIVWQYQNMYSLLSDNIYEVLRILTIYVRVRIRNFKTIRFRIRIRILANINLNKLFLTRIFCTKMA